MSDRLVTPERVDGSMSLLVDMMGDALDPAYADAARRRAAGPEDRPAPAKGRLGPLARAVVLLVLFGLLTGVAAAQVRGRANASGAARRALLADVQRQTTATDRLSRQVDQLRTAVAQARDTGLGDGARGRALAAQLSALELSTGQTKVTGPGLLVTLNDAQDPSTTTGNGRGGQLGDGRIYDRDLQDVVNALWAAGAEAISVNGQRLTALTAIRSAGEAILVDFRPLSPPYRLSAVGDVDAMQPAFADSATARRFTTYTSLYGLGFATQRVDRLSLPAATPPELRSARDANTASTASTTKPTVAPTGGTP
ncbi:MAG: hypothetical protein JWL79_2819 [Frankiales bacterium]|nr:hypothetical protein [Frankiales bacterium]